MGLKALIRGRGNPNIDRIYPFLAQSSFCKAGKIPEVGMPNTLTNHKNMACDTIQSNRCTCKLFPISLLINPDGSDQCISVQVGQCREENSLFAKCKISAPACTLFCLLYLSLFPQVKVLSFLYKCQLL